jgi:hypothetical protein
MHQTMHWIIRAGAILTLAAHASGAIAQNAGPTPTPPRPSMSAVSPSAGPANGPLPAPVGHRQPKPSDLPAETAKGENHTLEPALRDLDERLRICRGC